MSNVLEQINHKMYEAQMEVKRKLNDAVTNRGDVYCLKCAYLKIRSFNDHGSLHWWGGGIECLHPNNRSLRIKDNWFIKIKWEASERKPSEINENNDCKWFKRRRLWNIHNRMFG